MKGIVKMDAFGDDKELALAALTAAALYNLFTRPPAATDTYEKAVAELYEHYVEVYGPTFVQKANNLLVDMARRAA